MNIDVQESPLTLLDLQKQAHETSREKGFWDKDLGEETLNKKILLTVSELTEAMEALRDSPAEFVYMKDGKLEGFGAELADAIIRIGDLAEKVGLDLSTLVRLKMRYNSARPFMHGRKF